LAGTNRPYRLVGDDQFAQLLGGDACESVGQLGTEHVVGPPCLALLESFTDTEDDRQARREGRSRLLVHERVSLAQTMPPLALPDNDVTTARLEEHLRADLTCEGALRLVMAVLRSEGHGRGCEDLGNGGQPGEGRTNSDARGGVRR